MNLTDEELKLRASALRKAEEFEAIDLSGVFRLSLDEHRDFSNPHSKDNMRRLLTAWVGERDDVEGRIGQFFDEIRTRIMRPALQDMLAELAQAYRAVARGESKP